VNVADKNSPNHIAAIQNNNSTIRLMNPLGLAKKGDIVYVASFSSNAIQMINVANPVNPVPSGNILHSTTVRLAGVRGLTIVWDYLYAANNNDDSLQVFDITNPATPIALGYIRDTTRLDGIIDVVLSWSYAYASVYNTDRISVIDITNPASMSIVGQIVNSWSTRLDGPYKSILSGSLLYTASYLGNAIEVIDVSNPSNPVHVSSLLRTSSIKLGAPTSLVLDNSMLYVTSLADDAVEVIDVSNPNTPIHNTRLSRSTWSLLDGARDIVKSGSLLYVVSYYDNALQILEDGYSDANPYVENKIGYAYSGSISQIDQLLGTGNQATVKYQISNNSGATWYYWNGTTWASTTASYLRSNDITTINTNLYKFNTLSTSRSFKFRAFLIGSGAQVGELDNVSFTIDPNTPLVSSFAPWSGSLMPIGNFNITAAYSDAETGINTTSATLTLNKWTIGASGGVWWTNIASTYISSATRVITATGAKYVVKNLPYGKYRATFSINDNTGNRTIVERIFYVDALEWNISSSILDIGQITPWIPQTSSGDLLITIKTVGAGVDLGMKKNASLVSVAGTVIQNFDGSLGWWYKSFPYTWSTWSIPSSPAAVILFSQPKNIHPDGLKYTYTIPLKFSANVDLDQVAQDYFADLWFQTWYTYE
jgi:hypothetical protein